MYPTQIKSFKKLILLLIVIFNNSKKLLCATNGSLKNSLSTTAPAISFCIADLKVNDTSIKICEFGQGTFSTFRGYDKFKGKGAMWALVWKYLGQFKKPIWLVSSQLSPKNNCEIAYTNLRKLHGNTFTSLLKLQVNPFFKKAALSKYNTLEKQCITDFNGIVLVRQKGDLLKNIIRHNQNILFCDQKTSTFVNSKYLTHHLFKDDPFLSQYRPQCHIINKNANQKMLNNIIAKLPGTLCVIKPLNASMGKGVIIIEKEELPAITQIIIKKELHKYLPQDIPSSIIQYWNQYDQHNHFLVEEFVQSTPLCIDNEYYDPTMRIAFIITIQNNIMDVSFLDAYWKLPSKSLTEEGTLIEKHKSHVIKGRISSYPVSHSDFDRVTNELRYVLLDTFAKMYGEEQKVKIPYWLTQTAFRKYHYAKRK